MSKIWRVVTTIVLIVLLLAVVCVTVGFMTGAEFSRISQTFHSQYNISEYIEWAQVSYAEITSVLLG